VASAAEPLPGDPCTDALGTRHVPLGAEARIVSLVPSITELLFDLGLGAQVVGRTGFCIHPRPDVGAVPKLGGTKDLNLARLRALAPTHVIVNIDENRREDVEAMRAFVPNVVVTHPNAPEDNRALYRLAGALFDRERAAAQLIEALDVELAQCAALAATLAPERVLYLCWKDPWMAVASDTYIARTLATVGWQVLHGAGGFAGAARYPVVDLDEAVPRAQRVLLSSEPYPFSEADATALRQRYPVAQIDLIDAEMTSWYGSRAVAGLRYLRAVRSPSA
jgi:ABC-type Fe3+-hydroxamate transport system substrate-binding protein